MLNFSFHLPTQFEFGTGAERKAGEMIARFGGKRALVHYGGGSAVRSGLLARVLESLDAAGIAHVELGGVMPNPRDELVYQGIQMVRDQQLDFILAIGGGSSIDSGKAIAAGALYDGDFWDFFCGKALPETALPLGCILTIAAAGSESSNSCVITQASTQQKRGLNVELNRPRFALMNPELTYTLPAYQTAAGATDIMAHVMERYFSNEPESDVTDRLCEAILCSVVKAAPIAIENPNDYDSHAQLMWASTIAHNNTCGVGRVFDGASHKIEHELSGIYDVAHGAGLAVVFPAWLRWQLTHHEPSKLVQFAVRVWGCDIDLGHPERCAMQGIERYEAFLRSIGMPLTLRELGIENPDIQRIADGTRRNPGTDVCGFFTPMDTAAIVELLQIANG
ncbi:iron-containing alcohol dehydrogenase [Eubacteriales bacterium OttesenSCG-928-N13]|nr:iron-containing alcohol dehydrogenase [Eubacteriales bacterium OttesenSCG-928-N13]